MFSTRKIVSDLRRFRFLDARTGAMTRENADVMNIQLTIRALALAAILATSACTTVVEKKEPVTTSTTTTEETTSLHPMHGSSSTQTTTTQTR